MGCRDSMYWSRKLPGDSAKIQSLHGLQENQCWFTSSTISLMVGLVIRFGDGPLLYRF